MRSDFVERDILGHVLFALTPVNCLVCRLCLETGLRVDDALSIKTADLKKSAFTITEQKTGKKKRVRLSQSLKKELQSVSGSVYVFEHRTDPAKHRTRQAVFYDMKRAVKLFRLRDNITPHSLRKAYAVELMRKYGDIRKVAEALNHDEKHPNTTIIYALADILTNGCDYKKKR